MTNAMVPNEPATVKAMRPYERTELLKHVADEWRPAFLGSTAKALERKGLLYFDEDRLKGPRHYRLTSSGAAIKNYMIERNLK